MTSNWSLLIESFLQSVISGVLVGMIFGLMCAGLGLIYGVMRVVNFAQGEFLMLGMYAALYVSIALGAASILPQTASAYLSAILAGPILFVAAYLVHRLLLQGVTGTSAVGAENEGHYPQMILTLGVSLILQNGAQIAFGTLPETIKTSVAIKSWEIGPVFGDMEFFVNQARSVSCIIAIAITAILFLFVNRTPLGKTLRAASDNPIAAIYMGIDVSKAHRLAFCIGSAITGIAGGLIATYFPFHPHVGFDFVIIMYAGVVLGGLGSVLGAFWGGFIMGMVQQMATIVLPLQLQNAAVFAFFLVVLLIRPQGLFGRSAERV